ncbi:hypothetical protein BHU72_03835 [Desulfuribacillus stibiiarsenatis]|uniref:Anti-sigma factor RsgI-like middle domain-containing protein n=1 Tax=Desulfuribacillus stibiiarsenatis TaxID=1390249 RepID=A0A1E5L7H2_9FIRM|nr:hypothetical protein [Desulfuribacillus stibiiarsenatis]OEH85913.1 hypothetical protein BHU72_03835 [Desulfuribacillus stibiiarsenatis]
MKQPISNKRNLAKIVVTILFVCAWTAGGLYYFLDDTTHLSSHIIDEPETPSNLEDVTSQELDLQPYAIVTIDSYSSVELTINKDYQILSALGLNEHGKSLVLAISVLGNPFENALQQILDYNKANHLSLPASDLVATVYFVNERNGYSDIESHILDVFKQRINIENIYVIEVNEAIIQGAKKNHVSPSKFAFNLLQKRQLDDSQQYNLEKIVEQAEVNKASNASNKESITVKKYKIEAPKAPLVPTIPKIDEISIK